MSSMLSFQNAWPIKREAVYTLVHFHIFIYYLNRIGSQLAYFFNKTYSMLVNLQAISGGKKCCFDRKFYRLPPDEENTVEVTTSPKWPLTLRICVVVTYGMFDQNNIIYLIIISLLTLKITGKVGIIIMSNIIIIKIYYRMFGKFDQMVWKTR